MLYSNNNLNLTFAGPDFISTLIYSTNYTATLASPRSAAPLHQLPFPHPTFLAPELFDVAAAVTVKMRLRFIKQSMLL